MKKDSIFIKLPKTTLKLTWAYIFDLKSKRLETGSDIVHVYIVCFGCGMFLDALSKSLLLFLLW